MPARKTPAPKQVAAAGEARRRAAKADTAAAAEGGAEYVTTAVHLPKDLLRLLREVAVARADVAGGRPSVSAVLTDLVRENRAKLSKEAGR